MLVSFNPYSNPKRNPNFKALSPAEITKYTSDYEMTAKLKTLILINAIKLDDADKQSLTKIYQELKKKGEVAVSFVLGMILNK